MKFKYDIIPLWLVESAVAAGWEVVGYSEFVCGVPKFADIRILVKEG